MPHHPPRLHFHKLRKGSTSHPAAMAKKGLASILYKLRDAPRPRLSSSAPYYYFCYPPAPSSWPWPSCKHPRTSSFRARGDDGAMYRTVNTVYDASAECFLRRPSLDGGPDRSVQAVEEQEERMHETAVVRGVRSERLFFDPAGAEFLPKQEPHCDGEEAEAAAAGKAEAVLERGAVVVTVESEDPYGDFRASMAEMVAAHGLRDWQGLEELLAWYLKLNGKGVHGVIMGAFVDLLASMASSSPSSSSSCITFEESREGS